MKNRMIHSGGVFDFASNLQDASSRDLEQFQTVGARPWPPGPRSTVGTSTGARPIGFSTVGMGSVGGVFGQFAPVTAAVSRRLVPADPRATMVGRVGPFDLTGAMASIPGSTPKGGILDGSVIPTGQPGGGQYYEAREPRVIGSGAKVRSLPDPMIALRNIRQTSITPLDEAMKDARRPQPVRRGAAHPQSTLVPQRLAPRPNVQNQCPPGYRTFVDIIEGPKCVPAHGMSGLGDASRRPFPVSVSFAPPRMYGRSVFEGPVVGDRMAKQSLQPPFRPVSGFGASPDGLGAGPGESDCGCGGWKYSR